jgi:hypothetical protein
VTEPLPTKCEACAGALARAKLLAIVGWLLAGLNAVLSLLNSWLE